MIITGGQTANSSILRELNPAVKLAVFLSVIQITGLAESVLSFSVLTCAAAAVLITARISFLDVFYKVRPFFIILITTFVMNFFFASGLHGSMIQTYRFFLIILFSILLTELTEARAMVSILSMPVRGNAGRNLRVVMMVALEFIPIFIDDAKRTVKKLTLSPKYEKRPYMALFHPDEYIKPLIHSLLAHSDSVAARVDAGEYCSVHIKMPNFYEMMIAGCAVAIAVVYAAV